MNKVLITDPESQLTMDEMALRFLAMYETAKEMFDCHMSGEGYKDRQYYAFEAIMVQCLAVDTKDRGQYLWNLYNSVDEEDDE